MDALINIAAMFTVALAGLAMSYVAFRFFNRFVFKDVNFQDEIGKGNMAVAVFLAALVLGMFLFMGRALAADGVNRYDDHFRKWGRHHFGYTYPWQYFKAQGMTESAMNPDLCSHVGACGVMQFMPGTAVGMGLQDRFNAKASIEAGIRYDLQLWTYWGKRAAFTTWDQLAFAFMSYNAGPGNVKKFRAKAVASGVDPNSYEAIKPFVWKEPRDYVARAQRWCRRFDGGRGCEA